MNLQAITWLLTSVANQFAPSLRWKFYIFTHAAVFNGTLLTSEALARQLWSLCLSFCTDLSFALLLAITCAAPSLQCLYLDHTAHQLVGTPQNVIAIAEVSVTRVVKSKYM
jgi:hypothetical protein